MYAMADIAFEPINSKYSWGKYADFKVIVQMETGYINVTHLCGLATNKDGSKKEFRTWKRSNTSQELINEMSASVQICPDALLINPTVPNELRGTYAHPKLVPHIASWACVRFAIIVADIVNAHLIKEAMREKDILLREKEAQLQIKDVQIEEKITQIVEKDIQIVEKEVQIQMQTVQLEEKTIQITERESTIDRLEKKIDLQTEQITKQSEQIAELLGYAKDTKTTLNDTVEMLEAAEIERDGLAVDVEYTQKVVECTQKIAEATAKQVVAIATKLDIVSEISVPPDPILTREEVFVVMRKPNTVEYKVSRCQIRGSASSLDRCRAQGFTEQLYYTKGPNAVNLCNRIRATIPRSVGHKYGPFGILAPDPKKLLDYIISVEREKKKYAECDFKVSHK